MKLLTLTFISLLNPIIVKTPFIAKEINSCNICHADVRVRYSKSIHSERGIECIDCHGGDPGNLKLSSMSKASGFRGRFSRFSIPGFCAKCHSDARMMLQYGEYIDQYAIYRESEHGKLLNKGDPKVAICTDCHGVHDIKKVADPSSYVYWLNVPYTCARCHSDEKYMEGYGIPADQFEKYKESIHGILRFELRDPRSPGCPDCHGTHGATPPGVTEIHNVCGKCHLVQRKYFDNSPHRKAMEARKMSECVSCHGAHNIQKATLNLFISARTEKNGNGCLTCHNESSGEYKTGLSIKDAIERAETAVSDALKLMAAAKEKGFDVDEEMVKINQANTTLLELQPITHSLSLALVNEYVDNAVMSATDVKELVNAKMVEWWDRRVMLILNIFLFVMIIIFLLAKRRRLSKNGIKVLDQQKNIS